MQVPEAGIPAAAGRLAVLLVFDVGLGVQKPSIDVALVCPTSLGSLHEEVVGPGALPSLLGDWPAAQLSAQSQLDLSRHKEAKKSRRLKNLR